MEPPSLAISGGKSKARTLAHQHKLVLWYISVLITQSCPTLCDPMNCSPPGSSPWNFPGKSTGVGCHFLLQGIFLTQGSNPGLQHCGQTLLQSEPPGKPPVALKLLCLVGRSLPSLPCFSLLFILPLFVKSPQITTLPSCFSFSLGWFCLPSPVQCCRTVSIVLLDLAP